VTRVVHVCLPLREPLGGSYHRYATLVEGPSGWGEASPLPGYPCDPATAHAAAAEAAFGAWPAPMRHRVRVNALVPAVDPEAAAVLAVGAADVKVKVGDDDDVDRVAAVRQAAGPAARIRVDANGAWDVDGAVAAIARLGPYDVELVEQPVATLEELAAVRRRVTVPVAADECVRGIDDARALRRLDAADAVVLKVQPLGGLKPAMDVAAAAGVPAIVTSMYETSVGLAAGLALAAALPELPWACGLGTASLLAADVVADPIVPVDGVLTVRRPVPDPELVERYSVCG
jgi:o-succinylbenzoate synthase